MKLRSCLKRIRGLRALVRAWRAARKEYKLTFGSLKFTRDYSFEDRSSGSDSMLIVLAGYKPDLWEAVFGRLAKFLPAGIDVCVATSGRTDERLRALCAENHWSYLSTGRNNISLIQNMAIRLHPSAQWIYKMDEDVFLTEGVLERMKAAYGQASGRLSAEVGFVSPLLPINGYGHVKLLRKLGLEAAWEDRFGKLMFTEGLQRHTQILKNPEAARFMWGETDPRLADIDELGRFLAAQPEELTACPYRYSIGLILFARKTWMDMGAFGVDAAGSNLGLDEEQFCQYCVLQAKAMVVVENAVAGHFSYGPQTAAMLEYFKTSGFLSRLLVSASK